MAQPIQLSHGLGCGFCHEHLCGGHFNRTIRKIAPLGPNWVVTTLAGKAGTSGGADGTGSDARFAGPEDVAVDSADKIYVVNGNAIRKITPDGVVTTLAGLVMVSSDSVDGTNSDARFEFPIGLIVDSATNIFVADNGNNNVRKLTPDGTNWVVTTIAGLVPGDLTNGVGNRHALNLPTLPLTAQATFMWRIMEIAQSAKSHRTALSRPSPACACPASSLPMALTVRRGLRELRELQ